ncbi:hypothetical protein ACSV4D_14635 [Flavobacterium sp. ARAG 55.4]|uniref:hypothetical protein n=1 Tax=Flavobacterium sp. ARAG 55.4 TaxID=3451357 RepID=UPI003F483EA7
MRLKILLLFLFISFVVESQEIMTLKSKNYKATTAWSFITPNYALSNKIQVQIARTENGGILKLSAATTNTDFILSGTVYVYLSDNSFISCTDKGLFENSVNTLNSYFIFTAAEMNRLKKSNIESIRFNIKGNSNSFSSQTGNFTAINKQSYFTTAQSGSRNTFETFKEIAQLYI